MGFQIYRVDGRSLITNAAFREIFGSEPPPEYNVLEDDIAAARGILGLIHRAFAGETIDTPPVWYDPRELRQIKVTEGKRVAITSTFFPLRDRAGEVAYVAIVFKDVTAEIEAKEHAEARSREAEAAARRMRLLAQASELLAKSLEPAETLPELTHLLVPGFASVCSVILLEDDGSIRRLAHADVADDALVLEALRTTALPPRVTAELATILRRGELHHVADFAGWVESLVGQDHPYARGLARLGVGDTLLAPLVARGHAIGALKLAHLRSSGRRFGPEDGTLATDLGRGVGLALDNARLFEDARRARETAERERARLADAQERARLATEAAAIGTWEYDMASGRLVWDAQTRSLLGVPPDAPFDYEQSLELLIPEDRERMSAAIARAQAPGSDGRLDVEYRLVRDGRWIRATGHVVLHRTARMLGTIQDVTALKRAANEQQVQKERAEAASRAKDEFLAMLGHELRNPLSPILTALGILKLRGERAFEKERAVIERSVEHMVRLVDDLLDVSRITRGKLELKKTRVAVAEVVSSAVELASPLLESRAHRLDTSVSPADLAVVADEHRLSQVVANLLTNAAKYTEPGGSIAVVARRDGSDVVIEVTDTGRGIDPELLPQLFELFVQGRRTLDRSEGGLGLGLSIVRSLVELHGGRVSASSQGLGRGSTFTVRLPAPAADEAGPAPAPREQLAPGEPPARPRRVLVIDDNRDAAETLRELLELTGFEPRVAFDGPEGLSVAAGFDPDVALVDIGLPVMDGYEVARRFRSEPGGASRVLVALTGYGQAQDRARALAAGFDHHFVKPVDVNALLAVLATPRPGAPRA